MKTILQRTCIGCNEKKDKKELLRIAKNSFGKLQIDENYKMQGRGAYICNNIECVLKAKKKRKLERTFFNVDEDFYIELINKIENK